ncbi:hypothetical protein [Ramlibacter sp. PS4R-6]|uniref:hypothetical protein n=1 Tax=Ramlibacter sp. PS4R-6 TaxID=3133438 RepID=UPI0030B0EFBB
MKGTRRDFVRQGGWAVAGAYVPAQAQQQRPAADPAASVLAPAVVRTLRASAEAITGVAPLRGHYEAYWRYHALHDAKRRELYGRFADTVTASAAAAGIADFAAASPQSRLAVLQGLRSLPEQARAFERPVFQEILAIFQRTDAWLQLGYEAWPGSARGLDEYRRAPR